MFLCTSDPASSPQPFPEAGAFALSFARSAWKRQRPHSKYAALSLVRKTKIPQSADLMRGIERTNAQPYRYALVIGNTIFMETQRMNAFDTSIQSWLVHIAASSFVFTH